MLNQAIIFMAHPKRKISKQRRNKRRTHHKLKTLALTVCPTTKETHLRHHAYEVEGELYYAGKVLIAQADNSD